MMPHFITLRRVNWLIVWLIGVLLAFRFLPPSMLPMGTGIMPLWLHTVTEMFAIVIAAQTVGSRVWNTTPAVPTPVCAATDGPTS